MDKQTGAVSNYSFDQHVRLVASSRCHSCLSSAFPIHAVHLLSQGAVRRATPHALRATARQQREKLPPSQLSATATPISCHRPRFTESTVFGPQSSCLTDLIATRCPSLDTSHPQREPLVGHGTGGVVTPPGSRLIHTLTFDTYFTL